MSIIFLQRMLEQIPPGTLSANWRDFNFASFSREKILWDYQQEALKFALKALWLYYNQQEKTVEKRKADFFQQYIDFGLDKNLDIPVDESSAAKRNLKVLQKEYLNVIGDKLPFEQFVNSICFWMATGSGKSLVIVKLIEILHILIKRGEIPKNDILILAHRDDLLEQLQTHIQEYNSAGNFYINLYELRDYNEVKWSSPRLFIENEQTVFYYRSDNISDVQKEKIVDFRNYDQGGNWYILLDEAHKGDREDSKRQQIYSILARNGFIFNFSATFTENRDKITTAYNLNLSEFIRKGYGKNIYIFDQETKAFRNKDDFSENEKQKTVLKSLIMLTYLRKLEMRVKDVDHRLYHRPLMMTLVNSVNTHDADLKLFFRELARIANGEIFEKYWEEALSELINELLKQPFFIYDNIRKFKVDIEALNSISKTDLYRSVFNSISPGQIEIILRPSNYKEIAFKLKTSEEAFALLKIGDISTWLSEELTGFEINQRFDDESFFEKLNSKNSTVNLLLGSRSFYEGWDSNRPNIIMYINIGIGTDAKKFILQSIGRGARISPLPGYRKRYAELNASGALSDDEKIIYQQIKEIITPLESEIIFGTNHESLKTVVSGLKQDDKFLDSYELSLRLNKSETEGKLLLIPVFQKQKEHIYEIREQAKFALSRENFALLKDYLSYLNDDRLLLALHRLTPKTIIRLRELVFADENHFDLDGPHYNQVNVLINQLNNFISIESHKFDKFKLLEEEINHFKHVMVFLPTIKFEKFEQNLLSFYEKPKMISELREKYDAKQLNFDDFLKKISTISDCENFYYEGQEVQFKRLQKHYYIPLLTTDDERLEYLRGIIRVKSEVEFIKNLGLILQRQDNAFKNYDWWLFSRIDETSDHINIPYYYPVENRIANFKPDFIFWFQKEQEYKIVFVDPKGTSRTEYQYKVDGFRNLFEKDDKPIIFKHGDLEVSVRLFLYTKDKTWSADYYRRYWIDNPEDVAKR